MKTNLQKAQDFVIGECLSDYPEDATYEEIIGFILEGTEDEDAAQLVTIWEPLEDLDITPYMDCKVEAVKRLLDAHTIEAARDE